MARKRPPEAEKEDGFMVLFTALSMILVAFFILLNTMATIDEVRTRKVLESLVGTFGPMPGFIPQEVNPELQHLRRMPGIEELVQEVESLIDQRGAAAEASVEVREEGLLVIGLTNELVFGLGGVHISPRVFGLLDDLSAMLVRTGYEVRIEGHADLVVPRGVESNWYISGARASSVYRYMLNQEPGLDRYLWAYGLGDVRGSAEGEDRRVEIVVIPGGAR